MTVTETRAEMSTASINDLPDSAFAYIEPGGSKDDQGKTTPRSLRHFPIHDAAHVRNALARAPQSPFGDEAMPKIKAAAKKFGIEVSEDNSASRGPQWQQRRKRWAGSLIGRHERRNMHIVPGCVELRASPDGTGGTRYRFHGYASTFEQPFQMWDRWGDPYDELVARGGFTETLAGAFGGPDVRFFVGHNDAGLALARTAHGRWPGTMHLAQDSTGLDVDAPDLDGRNTEVRNLASAMERGDVDAMSIGFVAMGQEWSPDWTQRRLTSLDLHNGDVSVVSIPANPGTAGATMIAMPGEPAWSASWQPGAEDRAAALHPPMSGAHSHAHSAYGSQGSDGTHSHMHVHNNDSNHAHNHDAMRAAGQPHEHLGGGGQPDDYTPDYDPQVNTLNAVGCATDGCGVMNTPGSNYCNGCGRALYSEDGTIIVSDDGVPVELSGDSVTSMAQARAALELRQRQLALLALSRLSC